MVLLNRTTGAGLVLGTLALSACLWHANRGAGGRAFSHRLHVAEEGLDCTDCHAGAEDQERAGMPGPTTCNLCHAGLDEDREPARRAAAWFDDQGRLRRSRAEPLTDEVVFSHARHDGVECASCHGDVAGASRLPAATTPAMADCRTCHAERGAPAECATCHREIREDRPPPGHDDSWTRSHGRSLGGYATFDTARCDLCHQERECWSCHQVEAPADHGETWRRRAHGLAVTLDRGRCATCHGGDFCDRCHRSTRPLSHRAGFGAPRQGHCVSCHLPESSAGCRTCHVPGTGHAMAAPMPAGHHPAMNCRQCHGAGAPLPHPDQGDACTACHR